MCGIAGVRRYQDNNPINAEEVKVLLQSLEHRGNHATGIALMDTHGEIHTIKAAQPAWAFCAEKTTNEFLEAFLPDATMALLHTRAATIGNPEFNNNNHPMYLGKSAIVHNGTIANHTTLFNELKLERSAETDSDIFRAILDQHGMTKDAVKVMNRCVGSAAVAAFSQADPTKLLLARSGSPLVYGLTEDKLWWASEIGAIQRAVRPWISHHGLYARQFRSDVGYFSIPDHTAYILDTKTQSFRGEFKTCVNYKAPDYSRGNITYAEKMKKWKEEAKAARSKGVRLVLPPATVLEKFKVTECPGCKVLQEIPYADQWKDYFCTDCRVVLTALDKLTDKDMMIVQRPK